MHRFHKKPTRIRVSLGAPGPTEKAVKFCFWSVPDAAPWREVVALVVLRDALRVSALHEGDGGGLQRGRRRHECQRLAEDLKRGWRRGVADPP